MDTTPEHPAALRETLKRVNLRDLLTDHVAPERVRCWGFNELERHAAKYEFKRENNNL